MDENSITNLITDSTTAAQGLTSDQIMYICMALAGILTAIIGAIIVMHQNKTHREDEIAKINKKKNYGVWLLLFYKNAPFFRRYYQKINARIRILYPADYYTVNKKITNILAKSTIRGVLGILFILLVSGGDIFFICAGITLIIVAILGYADSALVKDENMILEQLSAAVSKIRHFYQTTGAVDTSLSLSLDEIPYEIGLHIENIYNAITSGNMGYEVDKLTSTSPNNYLTSLLAICASVKDWGDTTLDDGTSVFVNNLNYLKDTINQELIIQKKRKAAFKSLTKLCLVPVLGIKPIEIASMASMPEMADFYKGTNGIVSMIIVFMICIFNYLVIKTLKDKPHVIEKDVSFLSKVASIPLVEMLLTKIINHRFLKYQRIDKNMQAMGDFTGVSSFLLKRIVLGVSATVISVVLFTSSMVYEKINYVKDFANSYEDCIVPNEEYRQVMRGIGAEYTEIVLSMHGEISTEDLASQIKQDTNITNNTLAEAIAEDVLSRVNNYRNTYFRWWYMVVSLLIGLVFSLLPNLLMAIKSKVINGRKEDEIIQFQNLMLILSNLSGITVANILEWMERFAFCFKEDIAECRVNLSHGEKKALTDMKDGTTCEAFSDFIDNLLAIDKVGVSEAFEEIKTDRNYYREKQRVDAEIDIDVKSKFSMFLAMAPTLATIGLYLIAPLVQYAMSMMNEMPTA